MTSTIDPLYDAWQKMRDNPRQATVDSVNKLFDTADKVLSNARRGMVKGVEGAGRLFEQATDPAHRWWWMA